MEYVIDTFSEKDWDQVANIYRLGLETRLATFETTVPSWKSWDESHLDHSRWVARQNQTLLGWAALSPVSDRCVYGGVGEVSVYVDPSQSGQGVGSALLTEIIQSSEENGIWTLHSSMFPENVASVNLHEKFGFRKIGYREKIGQLDGKWRDTLLYERRSNKFN